MFLAAMRSIVGKQTEQEAKFIIKKLKLETNSGLNE